VWFEAHYLDFMSHNYAIIGSLFIHPLRRGFNNWSAFGAWTCKWNTFHKAGGGGWQNI